MNIRCVRWSIFLCLALGLTVKAQLTSIDQIRVDNEGYQNIMISIDSNVPSENGEKLVQSIQNILQSTSDVLHKAIGIPIASVTLLLPPSWSTSTWKNIVVNPASWDQTDRRPDIRVDATEKSPFGKQPTTLQHGGCGVRGHQITLPLDFVSSTEEFPKGKLLAREWLKYRFGVFDENGFPVDSFYPDYYRVLGGSEIRMTECTNSKVTYNFRNPDSGYVCNKISSFGQYEFCRPHPDEKSATNVTSSLMYFHKELPKMEHVCGKDGHPHDSTARNKQNALCNGRSIWDVVKQSGDFSDHQSKDSAPKSIQFSYIQEGKPRVVVLLENSDNLLQKESPIMLALRRFYYDLPSESKLAIYTYNSDVTGALPYDKVLAKERSDLGAFADFGIKPTNICTSCGLTKAAQILLLNGEVEKGSIFLITASPLDKVPKLPEKLRDSGIRLHVLRLTGDDFTEDESYGKLERLFGYFSYQLLELNLNDVDFFNTMFQFLMYHVPKLIDDIAMKTVLSGEMSAQKPLTFPREETAKLYTLWLGKVLESQSIECKAGDTVITLKPDTKATDIASFTFDPVDNDVTCKLSSTKQPPILTQVQMTTQRDQVFSFDTWIHDLSTEKEQRPIIVYAKIYFGGYPIKGANVTMVVNFGDKQEEIVMMLDNGFGDPDVTRYDGIYSGYFSSFLSAGGYTITVKVDDNGGSASIGKYDASNTTIASSPATCCGRTVISEDHDVPAFKMEKRIGYRPVNKSPEDGYPPSRIPNFKAVWFPSSRVTLMWQVPGGGKAVRYVVKLFENMDDAITKFDSTGQELNASNFKSDESRALPSVWRTNLYFKDLEYGTYYAAVRSWNEFNKSSEVSNVVEFIIRNPLETTTEEEDHHSSTPGSTTDGGITKHDPPKSSNKTIAIVFGVLGGIAFLCIVAYLGYYFFVKKPRRN